jgi:hypothetical protein
VEVGISPPNAQLVRTVLSGEQRVTQSAKKVEKKRVENWQELLRLHWVVREKPSLQLY